jgi:signal transduction histidine kinase/HPt (histidine-containing phosphotransfer) domain-containing protein/methylmalonyl-CoA mutase cobalamin-binding subunit
MNTLLGNFLKQSGFVLLERHEDGSFGLLSEAPEWFAQFWPDANSEARVSMQENSPFLANFLVDAEIFWNSGRFGMCESGTWIETNAGGEQTALEARAMHLDGKQVLAIFSPDTQYQEKAQLLQTARNSQLQQEKLLREIQKKEILLHCIVHDLSQPLSAMRGSFDCLALENDPESTAKFIELGKHASEQQESMIREILSAFAADLQADLNAERNINSAPDLLSTAKEAASTISPAFSAKGVRLSVIDKNSGQTNWRVRGEETRLRRIFTNLLENALRYTPANSGVTIGVEDEGAFLKAYVDDEGPGLPTDLRPVEIFALFGKEKKDGGKAGLGLYFCRVTVERWGGSIGCASLAELGSRFWFRLPKAPLNGIGSAMKKAEESKDDRKRMKQENRRRLRILLADDQEDIRVLTTHQLQRGGHQVVVVGNGQAAYESAQTGNFDIIFLDEEMPVLTGVETVRAIRDFQRGKGVSNIIVAFTGNNTPEDRVRLMDAGFDAVVGKPFRLESLDAFLHDPTDIKSVGSPPDERPFKSGASLEVLLQRVGGDEKLLRQMIRTFLRDTPKRLEIISKALKRKSGTDLAYYAHALKGSLGIFGAFEAVRQSQSLQDLGRLCDFEESGRVFGLLQEEIAKLRQNLRGYAKEAKAQSSAVGKEVQSKAKKAKKRKR